MGKKTVVAIASGYFNPLHKGHIELFYKAKEISDKLVVIVNNDLQVKLKGSTQFQNEDERCIMIRSLKPVDFVILSMDNDKSVSETIKYLYERYKKLEENPNNIQHEMYQLIFVNGGDQFSGSVSERDTCIEYGIPMVDGLGGKIQSSSDLLRMTH